MTHNFYLQEPVVTALQNQISNQISAAVAAVNADVTDGYTILTPTKVHGHVPMLSVLSGAGFPAVGIEDGPTRFEDDLVSSVTGWHQLVIVPFIANPDPEALVWQLRRFQQAIMLCIQADRTLGGVVWTTRLLGNEPGPLLAPADREAADNSYVSWTGITVECGRSEV
jgi:hypothetical protein